MIKECLVLLLDVLFLYSKVMPIPVYYIKQVYSGKYFNDKNYLKQHCCFL